MKRRAELPGRRRVKARPGIPVTVAEFSLYDVPADPEAVPAVSDAASGEFGASLPVDDTVDAPAADTGAADAPRREIAAFTVNFGRVDLALRTPGGDDVRVEMFLVAYPDSAGGADDSAVARIVAGATALVADDPEAARPTPGSVIPDAVRVGLDSGEGADAGGFDASGSTTPHLLCVVPYVWPDGVPTITEEPGKISVHGDEYAQDERDEEGTDGTGGWADAVTGGSRLTTVTQLVPITDAEYAHADANGVESLMELLAAADADLRDVRRRSVVKPSS
ncbi:suppressor of fused domain protein [uncultured Corynebacterium sp.]|uniref:suppressor of fused domain protein n=1 Tax=uncultured Corynebacterium sp. TaxID=159447 RepID=UPI0025FF249C|nr:suppressor of fused domain protein [uncultured Corynebacterium sp.]